MICVMTRSNVRIVVIMKKEYIICAYLDLATHDCRWVLAANKDTAMSINRASGMTDDTE